jgi:[acyl-carrier-protein] S-malonyltransferase
MGQMWQSSGSWSVVDSLSQVTGRDIGRLLTTADADELKLTSNAQLATFTLSLVILDSARSALSAASVEPIGVAGHSLGEYTALVAAGVLHPGSAATLVAERGAAMEAAAAANPGTMAAVLGLDPDGVEKACAGVDGAWVANDNAPGQVVIAGTGPGVEQASANARDLGAKRVMPLAVSGAFHTPLMAPAQDRLDAGLAATEFSDADIDCVANVDSDCHREAGAWPQLLSAQLCSPVRWRPTLLRLHDRGASMFVELGPGTELSGMVKRTVAGAVRVNVAVPDDLAKLTAAVAVGSA